MSRKSLVEPVSGPAYHQKHSELLDLVDAGRAEQVAPRKFRLLPLPVDHSRDQNMFVNMALDAAVHHNPLSPKGFTEAWTVRPSGGIPVRQLRTPRRELKTE